MSSSVSSNANEANFDDCSLHSYVVMSSNNHVSKFKYVYPDFSGYAALRAASTETIHVIKHDMDPNT